MPDRRALLTLFGAAFAANGAPPKAGLSDAVLAPGDPKVEKTDFGELRIYYEGPTEQLHLLHSGRLDLKPGMSPHPPHSHPEEELLFVAAGTGEISLNGKTIPAAPGSIMYAGSNHSHGIKNTGGTTLTFYWAKWQGKGV